MKKLVISLVFVLFLVSPVLCFGTTILYKSQESIFSDSADILSALFLANKIPINENEEAFLSQIRREKDLLYILSHGLPKKGVMISKNKRIPWKKIAKNTQADVLIVDSCFSGQILKQNEWLKKPSLIVSSTSEDNYSYNPLLSKDYRISLLSASLFIYFCENNLHQQIENYLNLNLNSYNYRLYSVFGLELMMRNIKYLHLMLYANLIVKEDFVRQIKIVEDAQGIKFKGLSAIEYKINR
jgi:hypothetical protein